MNVSITALYGSLAALVSLALALNVSRVRRKLGVSLGDKNLPEMIRAVRAHANNAEYTPLFIVMLLVNELAHGSSRILHVLGGAFVVARVLHAWGMFVSGGPSLPRLSGTTINHIVLVALAVQALRLRFGV
jgi:uncharacterized membrane protein YecN with MAPEG domain